MWCHDYFCFAKKLDCLPEAIIRQGKGGESHLLQSGDYLSFIDDFALGGISTRNVEVRVVAYGVILYIIIESCDCFVEEFGNVLRHKVGGRSRVRCPRSWR